MDTLIPMVFALLEILLALSAKHEIIYFSGLYAAISLWGAIAYLNTSMKHDRADTEELYKAHFSIEGDDFSKALLWAIKEFEKKEMVKLFFISIFYGILTFFIYIKAVNFSEDAYSIIVFIFVISTLIYLLIYDLGTCLCKVKKLAAYYWS